MSLPRELRVRVEAAGDAAAIHAVHAQAFPSDVEARLVDALRGVAEPRLSLVAEDQAAIVGHILFTPVTVGDDDGASRAMGLAPVAVVPRAQRRGIGSALVRAGLTVCRGAGARVVFVLGHPEYYPRFGFRPASEHRLYYGRPGPNPAFMVYEIVPGALRGLSGEVRYQRAFDAP